MAAVARYFDLLGKIKNVPTVTSAAGFIGSNFIRPLLVPQSDGEIANFAKATCAGNRENLADIAGIIGINLFMVILLTQSRW